VNSNPSQSSVILQILTTLRGRWVSMPDLAFASGGYAVHSRISELRRRGHVIENQVEQRGGKRVSRYRLVEVQS
jgi:biotin operon repressor